MKPRPNSLKEVACQSGSLSEFGRNMCEWLHEIRRFSSRRQMQGAVSDEPARLMDRFAEGKVADAWLAAYAEHVSSRIGCSPPDWAFEASRFADEPWFATGLDNSELRGLALLRSPLAFKRRNLYASDVELPLRLSAGQPRKSDVQKRRSNANRQRRFRARRSVELKDLRDRLSSVP
jgi:hypothetical protein